MKSWLLVGASQSLYLAFIIVRRGKRHPSQSILCLYFTIFSIIYGIVYASGNWEARELLFFLWNTNMLIGPFLLIYTLSLTASKEKTPAYIVYFIPYALSVLYSLYLLGVYDNEALEGIFSHRDYLQKPFLYLLFYLLEHISIPVFTFFSFLSLRRHKQYIEESFSYTEDINLNWLRNFIVIGFSLWLSYNIAYFFFPFLFDWSGETAQDISFIATIPFIFILAYQADKQQAIFHIQPPGISNKRKKYAKTGLTPSKRTRLARDIDERIRKKKLFLQTTLSLEELVDQTGYTKHNISETLNTEFNKTFYDYINEMRVQEFEAKIRDGQQKDYTLLSIAYDCGFNSKTSFNRIYKKLRGMTPTEYIRRRSTGER